MLRAFIVKVSVLDYLPICVVVISSVILVVSSIDICGNLYNISIDDRIILFNGIN